MALITSILTGGSNNHQTTSEEANAVFTDFVAEGVVGAVGNTSGVAPATGGFAVNAQGTPNMTVAVGAGVAYVTATPTSQSSQTLRVKNSATANLTISANSSGSTKYDWVYISISAANAANPNAAADNVATLTTSRSSSSSSDDGSPPTYGYALAVVTVANGASSITNANITDARDQTGTTADNADNSITNSMLATGIRPVTTIGETTFDFVASGCIWSGDSYGSTRAASMTSGVVYIGGVRVAVGAVAARTFTASKDTYVDVGTDGVVDYNESTNNAASQALAAGHIRLGIVITGAGSIASVASINQGQENKVLPIASSVPYAVTDSLGNLICPRDPNRRILGYRQRLSDFSVASATATQVTELSVPVIVPTGRKVEIEYFCRGVYDVTSGAFCVLSIWDGAVNVGTRLSEGVEKDSSTNGQNVVIAKVQTTPATASKTYNAALRASVGTVVAEGAAEYPLYLRVLLV